MRQLACDKINEMFGLDICYQFDNIDIDKTIDRGGEDNGALYDTGTDNMRDGIRTD